MIWDDAKDSGGVYVRPLYVRLAGDLVSGVLLSQLAYWCAPDKNGKTKLKVQFEGRYWLAKARDELCAECGMTVDQYRRAIRVLQDKGFVDVRIKLFAGKTTPHYALNFDVLQTAASAAIEGSSLNHLGHNPPTAQGVIPQPCLGANAPTITESEKGQEQTTDKHSSGEPVSRASPLTEGTLMATAAELLAKKSVPRWDNTPGGNAMRWQSRLATAYDCFQKPLTNKDRGMIKSLTESWGSRAPEIFDLAAGKWDSVMNYVKEHLGHKSGPKSPDLGYMIKNSHLFLQLIAELDQAEVVHDSKPKKITYVYD